MKKLIEALNIFIKYRDLDFPTSCEHDILYIVGISKGEVSQEDLDKLEELGFDWNDENEIFYSYKYGST